MWRALLAIGARFGGEEADETLLALLWLAALIFYLWSR